MADLAKAESIDCIQAPVITTQSIKAQNLVTAVKESDASWIFVSRTAVREFANQLIDLSLNFLPKGEVFAVGPGTRSELLSHFNTIEHITCPPISDSESLLTLKGLQTQDACQLYLVKGENGRPLLQQELTCRGFKVGQIDVYKRVEKQFSTESVNGWQQCSIFLATSVDIAIGILNNLKHALDGNPSVVLDKTKWLVLSERIKAHLISQGIENNLIYVCEDTNNSSIIKQIKQLAK